jgi:hypothetical protein
MLKLTLFVLTFCAAQLSWAQSALLFDADIVDERPFSHPNHKLLLEKLGRILNLVSVGRIKFDKKSLRSDVITYKYNNKLTTIKKLAGFVKGNETYWQGRTDDLWTASFQYVGDQLFGSIRCWDGVSDDRRGR